MELENTQNNALAKLPMLKLGEYEMWEIRIKQYFQIQDYALWEVIENGNSWVPIPVTTPSESGTSTTTKMTVPSTIEEKTCKKNDVKARSLLLMALPNEHQLTFDQYVDAQSMFAAIKARFGGNEATKKTQKALLKQQYENFSASSSESLDSIFNRLQKLVSRLAILGVVTPPEDLNVKFLRSLPSEWDTHVVVWMNKPDFDTMGLDDLYNNFKIVEQKVKKSAGASNDDKNLAFVTTSGASSTNNINTVNPEVSTATTKVNTASTEICTASFSDATVYAFLSTQPKGSQLVHEDLEQLHDDDLEEMDLKWNMALLSMRARKFYQRTGRKIIIDGSNTAGYDKSKVECFNCHKLGHFARECKALGSKDNRNWNQGSSTKVVKIEDASEKELGAIDGAGFDWSDMAEKEIQANMALMVFSDSEVNNNKSCLKNCLKNYEALKKQYDDLLVKLSDTGFKAATYKRGLATLEDQIVKYREHEVRFSEEIALLKRSVGSKEYQLGLLRTELEKVKQEKEGVDFKIAKFDKSAKDLNEMLESQITDKSKKGVGYNAVPSPHPLILNRPTPLDLSYSGLEEFKEPEVNEYGPRDSSLKPITGCDKESDNSKENTDDSLEQHQMTDTETSSFESPLKVDKDWKEKFFYPANHVSEVEPKKVRKNNDAPIIEDWVSDDEDEVETTIVVKKKTIIPTAVKIEKPVRKPVRYAELYRSQRPRGNQRNWNGQNSNQFGCNFVFNNKACFICGSFDHIQYSCPNQQRKRIVSGNNYNKEDNDYYSRTSHPSAYKHMAPRAVLMKTGLKSFNTARPVNTVRSVNTGRPFSTARSAEATNDDNGEVQITATIDGHSKTITEASLRRHLKLDDHDGITSSPSHSLEPSIEHSPDQTTAAISFPSLTQPTQPLPGAEQHIPTPYDSPLHAVHSHGSVEGSLKLNELTTLVTKLSERIGVLEDDLKKTKQTYSSAFTKLILKIKKLEFKVKTGKASTETEPIIQEVTPTEVIQDQGSSEKGNSEVSTAGATKGTTSEVPVVSTAKVNISTTGRTVTYRRRSEEKRTRKDKGKAIMTETEPVKKSKKLLEQERLGLEEAIRLQEQVDEEERAQVARDEEIARQLLALDEERVTTDPKTTKDIDWNGPSVQKYWDLKNKPKSEAQARKNMIIYLKNQSNYKMKDFKGMSYAEIRPIFEKIEKEQVEKDTIRKKKKSLPRKSTRSTVKRQKMEEDAENEELKGYLDIIPREDVPIDVESLSTKYPIVDWKTYTLSENFMYYKIIRRDGSSKNYKILSEMLYDFDRQDIMELYRLVKERYSSSKPEGYDLMLWGDLHTLFEPDKESKIWKNQNEYNLISLSLCDFCRVHILLMKNGIAIHMLREKKYPLSQEMISKMLNKRLEVDHESTQTYELLKFIRSQVQK
ncbi:putative ribonuclease H-like domain-containing protein [Tanacetum coccineum]